MIIETERMILREINDNDFDILAKMLKDIDVMYAWEHSFDDDEICAWIDRRKRGYAERGYDYFLAIDRITNEPIGQLGLLVEHLEDSEQLGLGWILLKEQWGKGYATEGGRALINYAFDKLKATQIIAKIRPENQSSINVALRLGLSEDGETIVNYQGKIMPHKIMLLKNTKSI